MLAFIAWPDPQQLAYPLGCAAVNSGLDQCEYRALHAGGQQDLPPALPRVSGFGRVISRPMILQTLLKIRPASMPPNRSASMPPNRSAIMPPSRSATRSSALYNNLIIVFSTNLMTRQPVRPATTPPDRQSPRPVIAVPVRRCQLEPGVGLSHLCPTERRAAVVR